jgi:hypothetical protein
MYDDFNDNILSPNWSILETTAACTQIETNQELQLGVPGGGWQTSSVLWNALSRRIADGLVIKWKMKRTSTTYYVGMEFTTDTTTPSFPTANCVFVLFDDYSGQRLSRRNAGSETTLWNDPTKPNINQYYTLELFLDPTNAILKRDDVTVFSGAHGVTWTTTPAYLKFSVFNPAAIIGCFDTAFIRKYVDPEPSHGAWGSEETPPPPWGGSALPQLEMAKAILGL